MTIPRRSLFLTVPAALALSGLPSARNSAAGAPDSATTLPPAPARPGVPLPAPIGARLAGHIPPETTQLLLVVGDDRNADSGTASFWTRESDGWRPRDAWPAHNGREGWTFDHHENDLRTPIGVYTLTDAGGLRPDPGTRLSYDRSDDFAIDGTGFAGEPLAGTFDHVIAIDYNRVPGTSPLDPVRPRGDEFGGDIWLHIDHGGATHGCVTLPPEALVSLLRVLDPAARPVVVLGDGPALAQDGPAS
ncbi:L,D-transpeptidase family protein [Embleya sp. NPDC020630]|uniref:L,D-transpeptidase family protein n=1 Tax=Embleya sp. NPDC020630 TaxID=3363979 RepID=UPI0037A1DB96